MYLDDGFGGAGSYTEALHSSSTIKADLLKFGFVIAEEKCKWEPSQNLIWLGLEWDLKEGKLRVTQERIDKILKSIEVLFAQLRNNYNRLVAVRFLASVVGQIISTQAVMGNEVRLRTRYAYECVIDRASWKAPVQISDKAEQEFIFWKNNIQKMNGRGSDLCQLTDANLFDTHMYCDASNSGYGGYLASEAGILDDGSCMYGNWSTSESAMSSTWRELESVNRMIKNSVEKLKGKNVYVNTDNKNVETILKVGSRKRALQDIDIEIHNTCQENCITISSNWIPRDKNDKADKLSRLNDCDDWGVQSWVFSYLDTIWGKHTFDRFASYYNRKCDNFNSKFWCFGTHGVDAFKFNWSNDVNWVVPPPSITCDAIHKIIRDRATCTLIVPEWKSAAFWPMIFNEKHLKPYILSYMYFPGTNFTHRGRGQNGIFGKKKLLFRFLALRIRFL